MMTPRLFESPHSFQFRVTTINASPDFARGRMGTVAEMLLRAFDARLP